MNIEIIGTNSNKINKPESDILKRIIKSYAQELDDKEIIENQLISLKLKMNRYLNSKISKIISSGTFIEELLVIYGIKKSSFANYIDMEVSNFHALLKGRRKINNELAKKLELIFGIEEQTWLFIETKNGIVKFNQQNKISSKKYNIKSLKKL